MRLSVLMVSGGITRSPVVEVIVAIVFAKRVHPVCILFASQPLDFGQVSQCSLVAIE